MTPKAYPPGYREFYEPRWFQPAAGGAHATRSSSSGDDVPFGTDVLVTLPHVDGFTLHTEICEDLWTPVPPSALAALAGATVLANLSASNVTVGKWEYRRDLVRMSAAKNLAVQLYSAAGFGESTADLAWDGHGLVADRGELVAETERFALGGRDGDGRRRPRGVADRPHATERPSGRTPRSTRDRVPDRRDRARRCPTARAPAPPATRCAATSIRCPSSPPIRRKRDHRCREIFLIKATALAQRLRSLPADATAPGASASRADGTRRRRCWSPCTRPI